MSYGTECCGGCGKWLTNGSLICSECQRKDNTQAMLKKIITLLEELNKKYENS